MLEITCVTILSTDIIFKLLLFNQVFESKPKNNNCVKKYFLLPLVI